MLIVNYDQFDILTLQAACREKHSFFSANLHRAMKDFAKQCVASIAVKCIIFISPIAEIFSAKQELTNSLFLRQNTILQIILC